MKTLNATKKTMSRKTLARRMVTKYTLMEKHLIRY
jgi:hypothetical protein